MKEDLYTILGVTPDSDGATLKAAWRKAAKELHPDRGSDGERLKQINAAYDVLKDPAKRASYDAQRRAGRAQHFTHNNDHVDVDSMFEDIFAEFFNTRTAWSQPTRAKQVVTMPIDLETVCMGGEKRITLKKVNGTTESITLTLPPGLQHGHLLQVEGRDLVLRISVKPHAQFETYGIHLHMTQPLSMVSAALGDTITIKDIYGKSHKLEIKEGTQTGQQIKIKGAGTPTPTGKGDLIVTLFVQTPTNLSEKDKTTLKKLGDQEMNTQSNSVWDNLKWIFGKN